MLLSTPPAKTPMKAPFVQHIAPEDQKLDSQNINALMGNGLGDLDLVAQVSQNDSVNKFVFKYSL
jgi:hypothetical protein